MWDGSGSIRVGYSFVFFTCRIWHPRIALLTGVHTYALPRHRQPPHGGRFVVVIVFRLSLFAGHRLGALSLAAGRSCLAGCDLAAPLDGAHDAATCAAEHPGEIGRAHV